MEGDLLNGILGGGTFRIDRSQWARLPPRVANENRKVTEDIVYSYFNLEFPQSPSGDSMRDYRAF
jgi:hypothetical protein